MKKLTKKQERNLKNNEKKFIPVVEREYILTDQCFWEENPPTDYNPTDPKRKPHAVSLVDKASGTIVMLKSGSIIKVIEAR